MPKVLENVIAAVSADPQTHTVTLIWANGTGTLHRFDRLIGRGVFAPRADPSFFEQARVGERGRSLEWPNDIDFCADALWFEAHPEAAPEQKRPKTPHAALEWR